jgi:hypothetical protein
MMNVAVVTDALSDGFFFPHWRRYYGGLFGDKNLFVIGYEGGCAFDDATLGGFVRLPHPYDDARRPDACAALIERLLKTYDTVVRVDADEFLVVDPRVAESLPDFLEMTSEAYYSARGFDVLQLPSDLPMTGGPMLTQRQAAYPNSALNKTAITRMPMRWGPGFHWASVPPRFSGLFMLHLKRIDIDWQVDWYRTMSRNIATNPDVGDDIREYYSADRERILSYHRQVAQRPVLRGIDAWYRDAHQAKFMDSIRRDPSSGLFVGEYGHELVLCELPDDFRTML